MKKWIPGSVLNLEPPHPLQEIIDLCREIEQAAKEKTMKTCHACGQTLPLKVGEVVEVTSFYRTRTSRGIVIALTPEGARVQPLTGETALCHTYAQMTRLHGYYRITEREAL